MEPHDNQKPKTSFSSDYEELPIKPSSKAPQRWWGDRKTIKPPGNRLALRVRSQVEEHLIDKLTVLPKAGFLLFLWAILVGLIFIIMIFQIRDLRLYYTFATPTDGGIYTEGIVWGSD